MSSMRTSAKGRAFLEREEGVVLRAYRDVVGVWTIGAGLTAASGVVKPAHGMTITQEEASRLLDRALERNYEPAVRDALRRRGKDDCAQHEMDGAVSFHFNTGAIKRASWVDAWHMDNPVGVREGLMKWVKGGGKVLPGLQRRRLKEANLIVDGVYGAQPTVSTSRLSGAAGVALPMSPEEIAAARAGFEALGYESDGAWPFSVATIEIFQRDHDLTVDGIVGRATLTTLQRRLDARKKTNATVAAGAGGGAATQTPGIGDALSTGTATVVLVGLGLAALYLAWKYRDVVAVKVQRFAPKLSAKLRSI